VTVLVLSGVVVFIDVPFEADRTQLEWHYTAIGVADDEAAGHARWEGYRIHLRGSRW
jgi:hypothetical protein